MARYDHIGIEYARYRRPDPRIASRIEAALGDARRVLDVGTGSGSYEPSDRSVVTLEPSAVMIDERPAGSAPAVRGTAQALPFADGSFDAVMAILTVHHWPDKELGLAELRRVAPRRVVFCFDTLLEHSFRLVRDYLPEIAELDYGHRSTPEQIAELVDASRIETVHVPWDCADGFLCAYWRRPEAYLDAAVRACISGIARLDPNVVERAMRRLQADRRSGRWTERHRDLFDLETVDLGYRLVVAG